MSVGYIESGKGIRLRTMVNSKFFWLVCAAKVIILYEYSKCLIIPRLFDNIWTLHRKNTIFAGYIYVELDI